jgi:hypothetical protein
VSRPATPPTHVATLELLEGPPPAIDAGAEVRLVVRAACVHGCDLGAAPLVIEGDDADTVGRPTCRAEHAGICDAQIVLRAPAALGSASWTVRLAGHEPAGFPHECAPLRVETDVVPHRTSIAVWQVPSPLKGSAFSVRVGVECSARCRLGGHAARVLTDSGEWLGEGILAGDALPESDGLYEAEVSLVAPDQAGVFFRRVRFDGRGLGLPHEPAEATFSFRSLEPPECTVTVRVVPDGSTDRLDGIEVRLGPYRTETDERGVARIEVSKGRHELTAWRIDLDPASIPIDVTGDTELTLAAAPRRRIDADEGREWM